MDWFYLQITNCLYFLVQCIYIVDNYFSSNLLVSDGISLHTKNDFERCRDFYDFYRNLNFKTIKNKIIICLRIFGIFIELKEQFAMNFVSNFRATWSQKKKSSPHKSNSKLKKKNRYIGNSKNTMRCYHVQKWVT